MKQKLALVAVVLVVLFAFGIRAVHPVDGLSSAMGSARSSIVVYKHASDYKVGQRVVVTVAGQGPELGTIKSATDETVDVDTKGAFVRVKRDEVGGKLLVVIPFFGTILGLIGL